VEYAFTRRFEKSSVGTVVCFLLNAADCFLSPGSEIFIPYSLKCRSGRITSGKVILQHRETSICWHS